MCIQAFEVKSGNMGELIKMKQDGLLLLGPTGSGKTPLGRHLQESGLGGCACHHFDFGEILRSSADSKTLLTHERAAVQESLRTGALLENRDFIIAEKLFLSFLKERNPNPQDLLIMNGLPRHASQAEDCSRLVRICLVLSLQAHAETISGRIRLNTGGDRASRTDDTLEYIQRKLQIYENRTKTLVDYYADRGIPILRIQVGLHTAPEEIAGQIPVPLVS